MKIKMNSRKFKYGGVSLILTVLVLVAVVIFNVIFAALGQRYEWMYKDMASSLVYSVSENYEKYISDFIIPDVERVREEKGNNEKISKILQQQNLFYEKKFKQNAKVKKNNQTKKKN